MAALTSLLLGVGLAASVAGTGVALYGQQKQTKALQQQEDLRNQQMELNTQRQRRDIIRNMVTSSAYARFAANGQGANRSSGLAGGLAGITDAAGRQTLATNQNYEIGNGMFAANQGYYNASGFTSFGNGLTSLGGAVLNNIGTLSRLGSYFGAGGGGATTLNGMSPQRGYG